MVVAIYQLISHLDDSVRYADEIELYRAFYILLAVATLLFFLSKDAFNRYQLHRLYVQTKNQLEQLWRQKLNNSSKTIKNEKELFQKLKHNNEPSNEELQQLKEDLEDRLRNLWLTATFSTFNFLSDLFK